MDNVLNKFLSAILVISIVFSLGTITYSLNRLSGAQVTGKVPGNVTLVISSSVSIKLNSAIIDFGSGYVNTTKNTVCGTNATLQAGPIYNDTGGQDCWTDNTKSPGPFLIENDGNVNATVNVTGPAELSFFTPSGGLPYSGGYPYNITWRARENETGVCNNGLQATWTNFGGRSKIVCNNMDYQPTNSDEIAVDVIVVVPANVLPGTYTNSTIEFSAVAA